MKIQRTLLMVAIVVIVALLAALVWNPFKVLSGKKDRNTVSIGYVIPLTGPAVTYTEIQKKAVQLALEEVNGAGGIRGKKMNVLFEESKLDPSVAVTAMKKLINVDNVPIVFGFSSGEVLSMATVANRTKTVLLAPMASAAGISDAGEYVFRLSPSDAFQGKILAGVVSNDGKRKVAVLYVNNDWGAGLKNSFCAHFRTVGGAITQTESSNPDDKDFRTQLRKIQASEPNALVLFLHPNEIIHAVRQIREIGLECALYGGDTFSVDAIYKEIPKLAEGIVFTLPAEPNSPEFQAFAKAYRTKFNESPDINAAVGYDAVKLTVELMRQTACSGPAIKEKMAAVKGYKGASGEITFDPNGDVISKKYNVLIIRDGRYVQR